MPVCAEECKEELSPAIEGVGPVLNEIGAVYEWEHFTESRLSNNYAQCILAQLFGVHVEFASLLHCTVHPTPDPILIRRTCLGRLPP